MAVTRRGGDLLPHAQAVSPQVIYATAIGAAVLGEQAPAALALGAAGLLLQGPGQRRDNDRGTGPSHDPVGLQRLVALGQPTFIGA